MLCMLSEEKCSYQSYLAMNSKSYNKWPGKVNPQCKSGMMVIVTTNSFFTGFKTPQDGSHHWHHFWGQQPVDTKVIDSSYAHSLVYHSVFIRKPSSCHREWNPQLIKGQWLRDHGAFSSKWDIYITHLLSRLKHVYSRGRGNALAARNGR